MPDDKPELYIPLSLDFGSPIGASSPSPSSSGSPTPLLAPGKSGKMYKVGIKRDNDLLYFIRDGDIWAMPRKRPGESKAGPMKLTSIGFTVELDKYLYYVDGDGDVARKARQMSGSDDDDE